MKFTGRTVTAIVEFPNNKILLVKRGTVVFKDYWALPGGRVDVGETGSLRGVGWTGCVGACMADNSLANGVGVV